MAIDKMQSALKGQIEKEITQYFTETVNIGENNDFSQPKLVRRVSLFENRIYPTGKFDSQGNYKYWFDIITPRIESEIKNIDFDTKDITAYSERKNDELACIITNLKIKEYLRRTGQAEEINSAVEEGAGWGNVVWKKVRGGYERVDLRNFYVVNQSAKSLNDTPVIERHQFSQSDLRAMLGKWESIREVIESCGSNTYQSALENQTKDTTTPYYDIYERNGEVSVKDLKEANGEKASKGDDERYVLARIIAAGKKGTVTNSVSIEYILFADEISKMPYKEYHRGRYKGRWWREGLYELLFDLQVRSNQIGNQLAQGLEFASKKVFRDEDKLIVQNILTDMKNGDIIRSKSLQAIDMRMDGFDQLINEYNRILQLANEIANSREIVQGDSLPAGTPLGLGQLYNQNANKLFDFLREKLAIPFSQIFEEWIVPDLIKELKAEEVLRLTGDSDMLDRLRQLIVNDWYINNLIALGAHTPEVAEALKTAQTELLASRSQLMMSGLSKYFEGFKPHVQIVITGEQVNLPAELQTMSTFAQLEGDPVRRSAIIEVMARKKGLDFGSLPKSPPVQLQPAPVKNEPKPTAV